MQHPIYFNPVTGAKFAAPNSDVAAWRKDTWLYNPWTGLRRSYLHVQRDPHGKDLQPPRTPGPLEPAPKQVFSTLDLSPKLAEGFVSSEELKASGKTAASAPDILDAASKHMRDRAATYDQASGERSMGRTVKAFNAILGREAITESEGWLLLQILKDVRDRQRVEPHRDSLEDCAAYAALKAEARLQEVTK